MNMRWWWRGWERVGGQKDRWLSYKLFICVCGCVCECVEEREREREVLFSLKINVS